MPPVPFAVRVTLVPEREPPIDSPLPVPEPLATRLSEPPDVMLLVVAMALPLLVFAESVKLKPPVPAVEVPLPVTAWVSVRVTLPAPAVDWVVVN